MPDTVHRFKAVASEPVGIQWSGALWPRPVALMLRRLREGTITWPSQVAGEMDNYEAEFRDCNPDWASLAPWCRGSIGMDPEGNIAPYAVAMAFRERIIGIRRDNLLHLAGSRGLCPDELPAGLLTGEVLGDSSDVEAEVLQLASEMVYALLVVHWTRCLEARIDRSTDMRRLMDGRMDLEAADFRELYAEMDWCMSSGDRDALRTDLAGRRAVYRRLGGTGV